MKVVHRFRVSWFLVALVVAVILGQLAAALLAEHTGFHPGSLAVAFLSVGLVCLITDAILHHHGL